MSDENKFKLELVMPEKYRHHEDEINQIVSDYLYHGVIYETTLGLLQECELSYANAVKLLADIDLARLELDTDNI